METEKKLFRNFLTLIMINVILLSCNKLTMRSGISKDEDSDREKTAQIQGRDSTGNKVLAEDLLDITPVRKMDPKIQIRLDSIGCYGPEKQRTILKDILIVLTNNFYKNDGIGFMEMKDRIFKYLNKGQYEIDRIYFYMISGNNFRARDGNDSVHIGDIKRESVVVSVTTKSKDSLNYILKCANGLLETTHQKFKIKKLIGELKNHTLNDTIYFGVNKSDIESLEEIEKDKISNCAKQILYDNSIRVAITGFTDSQGSRFNNYILSEKRAKCIKEYLIQLGVREKQISEYNGRGEDELIRNDYPNGIFNQQIARRNRRVLITMYSWSIE